MSVREVPSQSLVISYDLQLVSRGRKQQRRVGVWAGTGLHFGFWGQ